MKLVKAIITPERLESLKKALGENGFTGMIITALDIQREQKNMPDEHCDGFFPFDLQPRVQIEIVVDYPDVDHLISTIVESCRAEQIGNCRIMVIPLEKTISILNGEVLEEFVIPGTTRVTA